MPDRAAPSRSDAERFTSISDLGRLPAQAVAIYGASFQARLVINMALLTPRLFIPKEGHSPVTFCATQEEGRPFLAETRAERRRAGRDDDSQA